MSAMAFLEFSHVSKGYGAGADRREVLRGVDLAVEEGEFLAILGFYGTGKSTLINLMAGLEQADRGQICFKGQPVTVPGPERGVVFQSYALMPWLTVAGNVALAVDAVHGRLPRAKRAALVAKYIADGRAESCRAVPPGRAVGGLAAAGLGGAGTGDGSRAFAARRAALGT